MQTINKIKDIREWISSMHKEGKSMALVPTMGYFHDGHLSLMRKAKSENDLVIVSIFVNPTQFAPSEDLDRYPRNVDRDVQLAGEVGVDLIFNPSTDEMYPEGYTTSVDVGMLGEVLCGASRPGHFRGVATVVLKLFNIVQPDKAYFGMKDYQQLKVIERIVKDLNIPVEIVPVPTIREPDGLAMSSRNVYLNPEERKAALVLSRALAYGQELLDRSERSGMEIVRRVGEFIEKQPLARVEYVSLVDPESLEDVAKVEDRALLALAVRIGSTRLIDNAVLEV